MRTEHQADVERQKRADEGNRDRQDRDRDQAGYGRLPIQPDRVPAIGNQPLQKFPLILPQQRRRLRALCLAHRTEACCEQQTRQPDDDGKRHESGRNIA